MNDYLCLKRYLTVCCLLTSNHTLIATRIYTNTYFTGRYKYLSALQKYYKYILSIDFLFFCQNV